MTGRAMLKDINGDATAAGDKVEILEIPDGLLDGLPASEIGFIKGFVGRTVHVDEINGASMAVVLMADEGLGIYHFLLLPGSSLMKRPMRYLSIDGMMSGTGIHDVVNGGCLEPDELGLSAELQTQLSEWVARYSDSHRSGHSDPGELAELERVGLELAAALKLELPDCKIQYHSDATGKQVGPLYL